MDITNKQHLANLLTWSSGERDGRSPNKTNIVLPKPINAQNSKGTSSCFFTEGWDKEFHELRKANPDKNIELRIDDDELYAYNFKLDGKPVHMVGMTHYVTGATDTPPFLMTYGVLVSGHCEDITDVLDSFLINAHPNYRPDDHPIHLFANTLIERKNKEREERRKLYSVTTHETIQAWGGEERGQDGYWDATVTDKNGNATRVIVRNVFDFGYYGYPYRLAGTGTNNVFNEDVWTQTEREAVKWALEFSPIDHETRM